MSKISLEKAEFNGFNTGNLYYTIKMRGTALNNNANSFFTVDNSVSYTNRSRGIRVAFFDEDMNILSYKSFDVYGNRYTRYDLGNHLKYSSGYNYFLMLSYDAIGTNQYLDDCFSDVGGNLWFSISRQYDYSGNVTDFNRGNGAYRTPYVAFGTSENGIIYESIGSSNSGATSPHAHLTVSVPHKSQKDKLLINGVNPSLTEYQKTIIGSTSFTGYLKKKYQDYIKVVCNYKTYGTIGYRIRLYNGSTVETDHSGSINSNIIKDEKIILPRNNATSYRVDFYLSSGEILNMNYLVLNYTSYDQNNKGLNDSSSSISKYGNLCSYDLIENYIGFSPFDKESYLKIYNSNTNLIKNIFDSKNNSTGYFFHSTDQDDCYYNNNITYETPYIEVLRNDIYYYFGMFNKCYSNCEIYLKTYDDDFNLLNTIRTGNNTESNNHNPLVVNGNSDEREVGLNEFFILPEDADSTDKSFFDDIQNIRYGTIDNNGIHLNSSSYSVKYKRETKYFKLIITGDVKIFNPILSPLLPSISNDGNVYMGSFDEGVNLSGTRRRVLTMADDIDLGINSTVGGYTIISTANLITIGASILADEIFPAGMVVNFPGASIPNGWLKCNGAWLNKNTYPKLFSAIGTRYGSSGDNFKLPDLRGEFVRGWDDSRGVDSGRSLGSSQSQSIQSHNHVFKNAYYVEAYAIGNRITNNYNSKIGSHSTDYDNNYIYYFGDNTNNTGGSETRPRNVALQYMIKY